MKIKLFAPSLRLVASLVSLALLAACSRRVDVSVFVVTKGGDNLKLGLVKVRAISIDEAAAKLRPILVSRAKARTEAGKAEHELRVKYDPISDRLRTELDAAREREPLEKAEASKALVAFNQIVKESAHAAGDYEEAVRERTKLEYSDPRFTEFSKNLARYPLEFTAGNSPVWSEEGEMDFRESNLQKHSYKERAEKASEIVSRKPWEGLPGERLKVSEAARTLKIASEKAEQACADTRRIEKEYIKTRNVLDSSMTEPEKSDEEFLDVLPDHGPSATTDADGRCSLNLPSGKWLLTAHAGRQLPDGNREDYAWIVDASGSEHLTLSNDNLLRGGAGLEYTLQAAGR